MIDINITQWFGGKDAGAYLGYSRDWVEVRALKWEDKPVPGKIRYKTVKGPGDRKYCRADLDAFLE